MRLDFVNPVTLIPGQNTEAGAPIGLQNQIPFENVVPTFKLPEEGAKPEDKHEDDKAQLQQEAEEAGNSENDSEAPEIFNIVLQQNFRELFNLYLGNDERSLMRVVKKMRLFNNVEQKQTYSGMFLSEVDSKPLRSSTYSKTTFYYQNFPGKQFTGSL